MRKVLKTAGLVVLSALVIVLILTIVGRLSGRENIFTRSFQSAAAPVEKLFSSGAGKLEELRAALRDYEALQAENEELKARIAAMEEEVRKSQGANAENDRLRQLLELRYINHRSWRAIAREMHYDESWVYVLHGKALRQITVPAKVSR